jgi:hypothetical protein
MQILIDIAAVVIPSECRVFAGDIPEAHVSISAPERIPDHVMPGMGIAADKVLRPANTPKDSKAKAPRRLFLRAI